MSGNLNTGSIQAYQRQAEQQRRDELIVSHLPLVKHVIGRLIGDVPPGVDVENLESAGVLGLVEAAAKFDPARNAQFKTFAYLRIRGAIVDEMRRNSPLPQHVHARLALVRRACRTLPHPITVDAIATATGLSEDEVTDTLSAERMAKTMSWEQASESTGLEPAGGGEEPGAELERWESVQQLADAIQELEPKERIAVTLYYKEDLRLKEIAEVMKLSVSRVSRLLSKATFELGERLKTHRNSVLSHG
ncbi:sigma-70 family RNA polymerase sigma factor [Gemmata sp. JC717]|uniref:Sigma-70 family RNA polymerase sigma factor n=1 Tax=Gemmata algarum TaxID=2975278 RepID=A0ABU5EZA9_9BACT|nr:sigma-70 family RNA polymerase sigma factor [Gemmata algarum]MDY3551619.1 sigma-70 family RNA polymerase sigma factor [Gemmata algarum]MDY3560506.1 sigma-70 family RNA polymerase sigma factor [Gemmata algarum]